MYFRKKPLFVRIASSMFCGALLFSACGDDDDHVIVPVDTSTEEPTTENPAAPTPVFVDFSFEASGTISPVTATITNSSTGATEYSWTFEGGDPATSDQQNPGSVIFGSAGEFEIKLKASNSTEADSIVKTITVARSGEIITFENIKLGGVDQHDSIGCFFSTKTGKVYKEGEVTEEIGADIDIAYVAIEGGLRFFQTPTDVASWFLPEIPGAVNTDFINNMDNSATNVTVDDFDAMEDESLIKDIAIKHDNHALDYETPRIVLFQNNAGKKGVIKVTEISGRRDGYIVFDIKMQRDAN